ncbi:MAG: gamma-glutamyl-gamma-aminobutyrate hydrolase family protein [Clostridia bacterium]|nr:gamma-glutamyl-gamma-aminobutyrate hydrolase family protein [Clostridia bacterium]
MKQRPNIGITTSYENGKIFMNENYFSAVWNAGGMPVYLPRTIGGVSGYADTMDGLLLSGGGDVEPARFGEAKLGDSVVCSSERDEFEFKIFSEFLLRKKPILGVCRGIQLITVALGGSLFQDIPGHRQSEPSSEGTHTVHLSCGIAEMLGADSAEVNSFHHQAIKTLPDKLKIEAVSEDGIIEAVSMPDHPFLYAVQWHPEEMSGNGGVSEKLFAAFVDACTKRKNSAQ